MTGRVKAEDFRIMLFLGASAEMRALGDLAAMPPGAAAATGADPGAVTISLVAGGTERLAGRRSYGSLWRLVPQIAPACARLAAGQPALLRSAVTDVADGNYLLMEPAADTTRVSAIALNVAEGGHRFPDGAAAETLYRDVMARRDRLVAATRDGGRLPAEVALSTEVLDAALRREAAAADVLRAGLATDGAGG